MTILVGFWRGFLRLFGLDTCPVPSAQSQFATPQQRAARARPERLLRRD